jgi:hypothetical protein
MFNIARPSGAIQWSMGLDGTAPSGTNTGNNLVFYSYDNSGGFIGAPLQIERSTGNVSMSNNVEMIGDLVVGADTDAAGGFIEVNGLSGVSRVNDPIYNPVEGFVPSQTDFTVQRNVALPSVLPAGVNNYNIGAIFQLPKSGLYLVDGALGFNASAGADTFVCAPGDFISFFLQAQPAAPGILNGGVEVDVVPVPASTSQTDRAFSNCVVDKLTGSYNYQAIAVVYNFSGTMAATGGATLLAQVDIAALV